VPVAHTCNPGYSEAEIRGSQFEASPAKEFLRPYLEKPFTKIGLVEWLKIESLSSHPRTAKKKKN
jgi:hypothetical protein